MQEKAEIYLTLQARDNISNSLQETIIASYLNWLEQLFTLRGLLNLGHEMCATALTSVKQRGGKSLYRWRKYLFTQSYMVMAVCLVVLPCSLIAVYRRFTDAYCLHHQSDDCGSKHLWNVGKLLSDYTAQQPSRQPTSYSPPWQPEISQTYKNDIRKSSHSWYIEKEIFTNTNK
jgi:hypothetical protein